MDCDCELLHNEPPSIPLYLSPPRHLLASVLQAQENVCI